MSEESKKQGSLNPVTTPARSLIMLSQPVHSLLDEQAAIDALPAQLARLPRVAVSVAPVKAALAEMRNFNWVEAQRAQRLAFQRDLLPRLRESEGAAIAYFGAAPIPMAMHLGYLVGAWERTSIFLHHHKRRDWQWKADPERKGTPIVHRSAAPKDVVSSEGEVVVRIWTSHKVSADETKQVIPTSLAEFEIFTEPHGEDVLNSPEELEAVADEFKRVLTEIEELRPNATTIHVFASVPVGLAFRMGTLISPTMSAKVQTYQFTASDTPKHRPVLVIQEDIAPSRPLTAEETLAAKSLRAAWMADFANLKKFAQDFEKVPGTGWLARLFPGLGLESCRELPLGALQSIDSTVIKSSVVSGESPTNIDGFDFRRPGNEWLITDQLLSAIGSRFSATEDQLRAGRLLFLHEAIHLRDHRLTGPLSVGIGRFPKVLEEMDYQSDVWGVLHELAYTIEKDGAPTNYATLAMEIINSAVETFWAFDATERFDQRIQVRRVNRYLIWYWQLLAIEHCSSLEQVIHALLHKPHIEVAGPQIETLNERVYFSMHPASVRNPELCVIVENCMGRMGSGPVTNVNRILDGFRQHKGDEVMGALRGFYDSVVKPKN